MRAIVVLGVLALAAGVPAAARAGTFTFPAVADAQVNQSYPYSNYGYSTTLRAGTYPTVRSYVRFAVAGLGGGTVTRATLQFIPTAGSATGVTARRVTGSWSESTITYANAPPPVIASTDPASGAVNYGTWASIDVTPFVGGEGTVNLGLTRDSSVQLNFYSREAGTSYAPRLVVVTQVPPPPDTTAPTAPSGLTGSASSTTQVNLSWGASTDNVGVAGYRVYRNGAQVGGTAATSYADTGLNAGTTYSYTVRAYDAAANVSNASTAASVTTQSPPPPPTPTPRTFTFTPIADAYVDAGAPTTTYGADPTLHVASVPERRSYLRFSVTGLGLAPTRATLRVLAPQPTGDFVVRRVGDTTWTEAITYSTAPAVTVGAADPGTPAAAAGWIEIDVTPFVTGNGPVSLALTTTSSTETILSSFEAGIASSPQLVVQTPSVAPDGSLAWPISAAFYYPWFPEAWSQQGYNCGYAPPVGLPPTPSGCFTWYTPSAGFYSLDGTAGDAKIDTDIRTLQAAGQEAALVSWWGPYTKTDSRVSRLLARTHALGSPLKWALYYEAEGYGNPTASQIQSDLAYVTSTKRYTADSAYLRVDGQPVVFVYSADDTDCSVGTRWKSAAAPYNVHLVFKVVPGYRNCNLGVDWHQYAGSVAEDAQKGFSFTISPGFWKAGEPTPRLARDVNRWKTNVADLRNANVHWRLVTTYNEWGEGTSIESATQWASPSGYGAYVDALRPS